MSLPPPSLEPTAEHYSVTSSRVISLGCHVCGKTGSSRCSQCKSVSYCSSECQSQEWPDHQKHCVEQKCASLSLEDNPLVQLSKEYPDVWTKIKKLFVKNPDSIVYIDNTSKPPLLGQLTYDQYIELETTTTNVTFLEMYQTKLPTQILVVMRLEKNVWTGRISIKSPRNSV
jgi:hypothetical protein